MHKAQNITPDEVKKVAKLANLELQTQELEKFARQFSQTVEVVNQLNEIDTSKTQGTYQVNNLQNVSRDDIVNTDYSLTQEEALSQAKETFDGYFVVNRLIDSN